ncbi:hypothetical protein [Nocardioides sp. GCM10030258]|uniref:hypothetical protein n=1 Tax=unclassified Nocardioides TaxID=2615069 RepID=UPI00366CECAA
MSVVVSDTSEVVVTRRRTFDVAADSNKEFTMTGLRGRTGDAVECTVRVVRSELDD